MRPRPPGAAWAAALLAFAAAAGPAAGFLGVGDTSFVTVIANPAEAANWAQELERINAQLAAAQSTLDAVSRLRAYAGDPRAAAAGSPDLAALAADAAQVAGGPQTAGDLAAAWQGLGAAGQRSGALGLLQSAGAGQTMEVFGVAQPRDLALYAPMAATLDGAQRVRAQVSGEQRARADLASELALAWQRFRAAPTESSKQAILSEISELQAQDAVMASRRSALVDDLALADREDRASSAARGAAADESLLAESAALNGSARARAQGAESQRLATLGKPAAAPVSADYSGIRLWTPADTGTAP